MTGWTGNRGGVKGWRRRHDGRSRRGERGAERGMMQRELRSGKGLRNFVVVGRVEWYTWSGFCITVHICNECIDLLTEHQISICISLD